ncbi:MAG TPA: right-handed parallel beta-helix repeat-containing protein [Thermohalobaculum sp.]|nr:right-handed parallel beta-helix repeat-containing protein [Thermohalobaculum sp.]
MKMRKTLLLLAGCMSMLLAGFTTHAVAAPKGISACGTITRAGAYILARNINGTAILGDCIIIDSPHVTLDLNGFGIGGPGLVGGIVAGDGIVVLNGHKNVEIRNGTVTGWINGIIFESGTDGAIVEGIRSHDNTNSGMQVLGAGALIRNNVAHDNTASGILFQNTSTVMNNVTNNNGLFGIVGSCDSTIMFNTATGNGTTNLNVTPAANCVIDFNTAP